MAPPRIAAAASAARVTRNVTSSEPNKLGPSVNSACADRERAGQDVDWDALDADHGLPKSE